MPTESYEKISNILTCVIENPGGEKRDGEGTGKIF